MKKLKYKFLKLFSPKGITSKPQGAMENKNNSFYDLKFRSIDSEEIDFNKYKGKKVLIVNTASECGFTPQYEELQHLHETQGNKVIILGFPSNNFGGQEPASNNDIGTFCQKNFGVTFQLFEKSDVVGKNQNPIYYWLSHKEENGWNDEKPNWNFCKYLISENGELLKFYSAAVSPLSDEVSNVL